MKRFAVIAAFILPFIVLLPLLKTASDAQPADTAATLPFNLIDNRIFIAVTLNGHGPFHCILDTGADAMITSELAKSLGLKVTSAGQTGGVGEKMVDYGAAYVSQLKIGGLDVGGIDVAVIPSEDSQNVFGTIPMDGVIGLPIFEKYVVKIDYLQHQVTFLPFHAFVHKGSGAVVPFERLAQIPVVKSELDGVPARFGIDTGARSSLLLYAPFVEKNDLRKKYNAKLEGITGWGIGGPVRSQIARAKHLKLGDVETHDLVIRLPLQKSGLTTGSHLDGLVGPDVLKQFTVYFDYSRRRMTLEKNANFGRHDTYDKLGAWLGQDGAKFVVLDVIAGGAASDAGLRAGDRILEVNGKDTTLLSLPEVREHFKTSEPGTKVLLRFVREGKQQLVVVTLRELV
jgi:hypothetical protein